MSLHSLVGPPVVALVATAALAYGGFRTLGALVGDGDGALSRVRKFVWVGLPVTVAVAFAVLSLAGLPDLVDAVLESVAPSLVGSRVDWVASQLATGTGCVLVAIAGYLGLWPAITRARDVEMAAATAARRMLRYGFVLVACVVLGLQGVLAATSGPWWVAVVAVVVGMAGLVAVSPYAVRLSHPTRAPTAAERERVDSLAADVDAAFETVHVSELADAGTAWIDARGLPTRRHLHVTDYLLDELDDEELRALLASTAERSRRYFLTARLAPLAVVLAAAAALLAVRTLRYWPIALLLVAGAVVVGLLVSRRIVFAADAAVAERVGTDAFAAALRRYADLNDADYDYGRIAGFFLGAPPLPRRFAALGVADPDRTRPTEPAVEDERERPGSGTGDEREVPDSDGRASDDDAERDSDDGEEVDPWGVPRRDDDPVD